MQFDQLKRRKFITLLGGAAAACWPLAARAQQDDRRRVGIFMDLAEQDREGRTRVAAFREGMQKLGWIEGRNVTYEYRWTAGDPAVMERYAAELLALKPEVIMKRRLAYTGRNAEANSDNTDCVRAGPRSRRRRFCG